MRTELLVWGPIYVIVEDSKLSRCKGSKIESISGLDPLSLVAAVKANNFSDKCMGRHISARAVNRIVCDVWIIFGFPSCTSFET